MASEGEPYVGRAGDVRRRLLRLMKKRDKPGKLLNLREIATRIEYWPVSSRLQSWLVLYECARRYLPATYPDLLKLRFPPYVRLLTGNTFPRTQVSTRIHGPGLTFGPFRSRALADQFEHDLLDLFQIRRCQEDLQPSPEHPGCIYGEMSMCLRPCQSVVSIEEYGSEAGRVSEFLRSEGKSALHTSQAARDRLSAEMEFEAAAREHQRVEQIEALVRLKEELARDVSQLCGVSVQPGPRAGTAGLWFLVGGVWQKPLLFASDSKETIPLDRRLRELVARLQPVEVSPREREEHVAMLARWYWSSWRDGIWIRAENMEKLSWRRLTTAVSKVVHESAAAASDPVEQGNKQCREKSSLVLAMALMLAGCGSVRINRILADPAHYSNRGVTVEGRVVNVVGALRHGAVRSRRRHGTDLCGVGAWEYRTKDARVKVTGLCSPGSTSWAGRWGPRSRNRGTASGTDAGLWVLRVCCCANGEGHAGFEVCCYYRLCHHGHAVEVGNAVYGVGYVLLGGNGAAVEHRGPSGRCQTAWMRRRR